MVGRTWQKINGNRHSCQWWQYLHERKLTAMTSAAVLLLITLLLLAGTAGITGIGAADTRDPSFSLFPPNHVERPTIPWPWWQRWLR